MEDRPIARTVVRVVQILGWLGAMALIGAASAYSMGSDGAAKIIAAAAIVALAGGGVVHVLCEAALAIFDCSESLMRLRDLETHKAKSVAAAQMETRPQKQLSMLADDAAMAERIMKGSIAAKSSAVL